LALIALEEVKFLKSGRYYSPKERLRRAEILCVECSRQVTDTRVEGCNTCRDFDGSMRIAG